MTMGLRTRRTRTVGWMLIGAGVVAVASWIALLYALLHTAEKYW